MSEPAKPAVASPCIGVCRMDDAAGHCEGCWRTLAEIAEWGRASETRRREILDLVASRRLAGEPVVPRRERSR